MNKHRQGHNGVLLYCFSSSLGKTNLYLDLVDCRRNKENNQCKIIPY